VARPITATVGNADRSGGLGAERPRGSATGSAKVALLLRVSSLYSGSAGALALLAPRSAVAGLKSDPTPFDVFVTRTVGTISVAFAIATWSAPPRPGILFANLVMNVVLGGVDTAAIADGTIGSGNWRGVAVHGGLTAAFGWALVGRRARTAESAL
jgi:hypothetical protein